MVIFQGRTVKLPGNTPWLFAQNDRTCMDMWHVFCHVLWRVKRGEYMNVKLRSWGRSLFILAEVTMFLVSIVKWVSIDLALLDLNREVRKRYSHKTYRFLKTSAAPWNKKATGKETQYTGTDTFRLSSFGVTVQLPFAATWTSFRCNQHLSPPLNQQKLPVHFRFWWVYSVFDFVVHRGFFFVHFFATKLTSSDPSEELVEFTDDFCIPPKMGGFVMVKKHGEIIYLDLVTWCLWFFRVIFDCFCIFTIIELFTWMLLSLFLGNLILYQILCRHMFLFCYLFFVQPF